MLVLSRKVEQVVKIGEAVVKIVRLGRGQVKLGIEAPKDVRILRGELEERKGRAA